jgi:hypothetical protein
MVSMFMKIKSWEIEYFNFFWSDNQGKIRFEKVQFAKKQ